MRPPFLQSAAWALIELQTEIASGIANDKPKYVGYYIMKYHTTVILSLLLLSACLVQMVGRERTSTPPSSVRVDFEGTHALVSGGSSGSSGEVPYPAGPAARVDFEGTHEPDGLPVGSPTKKASSGGHGYVSGSPVRVDFEGTHPPK